MDSCVHGALSDKQVHSKLYMRSTDRMNFIYLQNKNDCMLQSILYNTFTSWHSVYVFAQPTK